MKEKDLPIDRSKHVVYTKNAKKCVQKLLHRYGNAFMGVFYNALRRLKTTLKNANCSELLNSTRHGQRVNTEMFDCDYYAWQDKNTDIEHSFAGEFLSEYSWAESTLATMMNDKES